MTDSKADKYIDTGQVEVLTKEQAEEFMKARGIKTRTLENGGVKLMNCAGMDVHKKVLVIAVCKTDPLSLVPTFFIYRTTVHAEDVMEAARLLKSMGIVDVAMESSGKYWYGPYKVLEEEGLSPVLTHPKYVKAPKGKKNDVNDAIHIANCFRMGMVIPSFVPPADIRDMRELCRYRMKLIATITQEKNRYQNGLAACNIRLDNVFSDVFGVTCQKIMDVALNNGLGSITVETLQGLLGKNCKATPEEVMNAIEGGEFVGSQQLKLQLHKEHIDSVASIIAKIDEKLKAYAVTYKKEIDHIMSMVAVKETAAIYILAEIGPDMSVWSNMDSFANWAGLVPASNSSAGKHKSTHIGNGGYYLKPVLVQCALAAVKSKSCPYFAFKYGNWKNRRGHKKAIIAVAHKMACCIYAMLSKDEDFKPSDYDTYYKRKQEANKKPKLPWTYSDLEELMRKYNLPEDAIKSVVDKIRESSRALPVGPNAKEGAAVEPKAADDKDGQIKEPKAADENGQAQEPKVTDEKGEIQEPKAGTEKKEEKEDDGNGATHDGPAHGNGRYGNGTDGNAGKTAGRISKKAAGNVPSLGSPGKGIEEGTDPKASGRTEKVSSNGDSPAEGNAQGADAGPSPKKPAKRPGRPKKTAPVMEAPA